MIEQQVSSRVESKARASFRDANRRTSCSPYNDTARTVDHPRGPQTCTHDKCRRCRDLAEAHGGVLASCRAPSSARCREGTPPNSAGRWVARVAGSRVGRLSVVLMSLSRCWRVRGAVSSVVEEGNLRELRGAKVSLVARPCETIAVRTARP